MDNTTTTETAQPVQIELAYQDQKFTARDWLRKALAFVSIVLLVYMGVRYLDHLAATARTVIVCTQYDDGSALDCYQVS